MRAPAARANSRAAARGTAATAAKSVDSKGGIGIAGLASSGSEGSADMAGERGAVRDDRGFRRGEGDAFADFERAGEVVIGGGEGAHNLPIGRRAGGDVEGVDVDFNLAVDAGGEWRARHCRS